MSVPVQERHTIDDADSEGAVCGRGRGFVESGHKSGRDWIQSNAGEI